MVLPIRSTVCLPFLFTFKDPRIFQPHFAQKCYGRPSLKFAKRCTLCTPIIYKKLGGGASLDFFLRTTRTAGYTIYKPSSTQLFKALERPFVRYMAGTIKDLKKIGQKGRMVLPQRRAWTKCKNAVRNKKKECCAKKKHGGFVTLLIFFGFLIYVYRM